MVSIIIPIFNAEAYLKQCIQSVIGQTYNDWELLLVNDGSTDSSGTICDEYAICDNRIRAIHKENTGVSDTRNVGLDLAQGEFIIFLDADDYWCDNTALGNLVHAAEKYNLDIIRGEYRAVDQDGKCLFEHPITKSKQMLSMQVLSSGRFYTQIMRGENFLWLALIRRDAIGNLIFNPNRSFLEDMEFYAYLLLQPLRCMFVPIRFYAYRKLATSASHTSNVKNLADAFSMCYVFNECCNYVIDQELKNAYRYNSIMKYYLTLKNLSLPVFYNRRQSIIKQLSIENLQKDVSSWAQREKNHYPIFVYIKPRYSILLLKYMLLFYGMFLRLVSKFKQMKTC